METRFQTSFIPRTPVTDKVSSRPSSASFFFLITFVIFILSAGSAAAAYLYNTSIDSSIKTNQDQLSLNKNGLDTVTIKEFTRLSNRINTVDTLLKNHLAISSFFQMLSNATLKTVSFNSFSFTYGDGKILVSMSGTAQSYESIALQAKKFTDYSEENYKGVFKSPVFSGLNLDQNGNVSFTFTTGLDPVLFNFYKNKTTALKQ